MSAVFSSVCNYVIIIAYMNGFSWSWDADLLELDKLDYLFMLLNPHIVSPTSSFEEKTNFHDWRLAEQWLN